MLNRASSSAGTLRILSDGLSYALLLRMANKKVDQNIAILALILNIVIMPGLGTIIGGRTNEGVIQLVLFLVSIPLCFLIVGFPLMLGMWIWALISGISILNESRA